MPKQRLVALDYCYGNLFRHGTKRFKRYLRLFFISSYIIIFLNLVNKIP